MDKLDDCLDVIPDIIEVVLESLTDSKMKL